MVDLSSPVLDLTGSLRALRADVVDTGGLGRSLCQTSGGSSLALAGRGGLPPSARGLQRVEPTVPGSLAQASGGVDLPPGMNQPLAAVKVPLAHPDVATVLRGCL